MRLAETLGIHISSSSFLFLVGSFRSWRTTVLVCAQPCGKLRDCVLYLPGKAWCSLALLGAVWADQKVLNSGEKKWHAVLWLRAITIIHCEITSGSVIILIFHLFGFCVYLSTYSNTHKKRKYKHKWFWNLCWMR